MTPADAPTVFVVDDDPAVRASIQGLLKSASLRSESFGTAEEFLHSRRPDGPSCLVLDVSLPGVNGLDFQRQLADAGVQIPIVFITGHGDIPMTVRAMKSGAVEFLTKPFQDQDLLDAIHQALDRDRLARRQQSNLAGLRKRFETLTAREREVVALLAQGHTNRAIANVMVISARTAENYVQRVLNRLGLRSRTEVAAWAVEHGLPGPSARF